MGSFSWKTSDTKENIMDIFSGECRTVYLLQPYRQNIAEYRYEGYGDFGGVDAYQWLAEMNIYKTVIKRAVSLGIEVRTLGIYMDGDYYFDTRSGKQYAYKLSSLFDELNPFSGSYFTEVDGVTIYELIKTGIWEKKSLKDFFGEARYPLKFSFDKNANYNALEPSEVADN